MDTLRMIEDLISKSDQKPKRPRVIAIDLDGTILKYRHGMSLEEFGEPIEGVIDELNEMRKLGYKIAIWTCRSNTKDIEKYLKDKGVPFDWINENPHAPEGSTSPKIFADAYVDDKAVGVRGPVKGLAERVKFVVEHN